MRRAPPAPHRPTRTVNIGSAHPASHAVVRRINASLPLVLQGGGAPQIVFSGTSKIAEGASNGTVIGTFSVVGGSGSYTWSEIADPDSKFTLSAADLTKSATLSYATKSSHTFTVRATGTGSPADLQVTILVMAVPAQIGSGDWSVADLGTNGDALITISVAPDARNSPITSYEYQVGAGAWTTLGSTIGAYPIAGLTDGSAANIGVRAVNAIGNGTGSATKSVTSTGVPAAFVDANWSVVGGNNKVTVTVATNPANNGSAITAIQYSKDGGAWTNSGISAPGSFDIAGTNGVSVSVQLRAVNANGLGPTGNTESATPAAWAVGTPTIAVVDPVTNPPDFDIGLDIDGGDAVLVGDVLRLRLDGGTTYDSAALTLDMLLGIDPITFATGSLSTGSHTAELAVIRSAVQVSAWSTADTFDIDAFDDFTLLIATHGLGRSTANTTLTIATQGFIP